MKDFFFTTRRGVAALLLAVLAVAPGCELFEADNPPDLNGPDIDVILQDATLSQIRDLAIGTEAQARVDLNLYLIDVGVVGREYWRFSSADPRFTGDLLGKSTSILDNNSFYITRPWGARYAAIRNACTMLQALDVTTVPENQLSEANKTAARGFANTWIAYELLLNSNLTDEAGVRIDVCDANVIAPLVTGRQAVLDRLASMLDAAYDDLQQGSLFFPTTVDVDGDPTDADADFREFNRAIAARVDAYREDWQGVLDALDDSFIDATGDLRAGAYHVFSAGGGDITNPFFIDPQASTGNSLIAHPSFIADAQAGDRRVDEKVALRPEPATFDGLTGRYGVAVYDSPVAPLPIITNAELVLLRAEARLASGNTGDAVDDLDVIRDAAGLEDYSGATDAASLLDELLYQRRYELYGEGHRWIDARRYQILNTLPIDREGDDVWASFPIPFNENVGG